MDDDKKKFKIDIKQLKGQVFRKNNLKNANFWGFILAALCLFLVVVVPLTITNNEVKAAKEKAAAEAQRAFEEAKAAAEEAQRKAEEERLLAMNSALAEQRAAEEAAEKERLAAEKAAKEREELLSEFNKKTFETVSGIVLNQMEEDFSTQYAIQDNLIDTQSATIDSYKNLLDKQTDEIISALVVINGNVSKISGQIDTIDTQVDKLHERMEQEKEDQKKAEEFHLSKKNHIDVIASGSGSILNTNGGSEKADVISGSVSAVRKFTKNLSVGVEASVSTSGNVSFFGILDFCPIDKTKCSISIKPGVGLSYDIQENVFGTSFKTTAAARYTITEGLDLVYAPSLQIITDFDTKALFNFMPLSFGMSFSF